MKNQVNHIINNYLKSQIEEFKIYLEENEIIETLKKSSNVLHKPKDDKKEKEREETIKKCNYIAIENINIVNIGNKILWNLYLVKDEKESSEDFIFCDNNKKKDNLYLLTGNGFFPPNQEIMHSVGLKIKNPKSNNSYK